MRLDAGGIHVLTRAHNGNAVIALYVRPHRYLGEPFMLHHLEAALLTAAHLQKSACRAQLNRAAEKTKYGRFGTVYIDWSADPTV
jgi:hypothetical protein